MTFQTHFLNFVTENLLDSSLLQEIKPVGELNAQGVLDVYRSDYIARMFEALSSNFEATWLMMGDDDFMAEAKSYISQFPSNLSNITNYGGHFPDYLNEKYNDSDIVTMASFEKTFWKYFHLKETFENPLTQNDFDFEFQNLTQKLTLFHANFDLLNLWNNRQEPEKAIYQEKTQYLAIYRKNTKVEIQELSSETYQLLKLIIEIKQITRVMSAVTNLGLTIGPEHWAEYFQILAFCR